MLATPNSPHSDNSSTSFPFAASALYRLGANLLLSVLLVIAPSVLGQNPPSLDRSRELYNEARRILDEKPNDVKAAWTVGRTAYDLADLIEDPSEHKQVAEVGIAACRRGISVESPSAQAHYYLALNLGQLAREKKIGALKLLKEMERELSKTLELEPTLDYAGPDRSLGMLYLEAPPWPASVGSKKKARSHLEAAVELSPQYPENHLCLAEAFAKWSDSKNLEHEIKVLGQLLPQSKSHFPTEVWEANWKDWETRFTKLQKSQTQIAAQPHPVPSERGGHRR